MAEAEAALPLQVCGWYGGGAQASGGLEVSPAHQWGLRWWQAEAAVAEAQKGRPRRTVVHLTPIQEGAVRAWVVVSAATCGVSTILLSPLFGARGAAVCEGRGARPIQQMSD